MARDSWFDEAAGPLIRPFAMAGGRTRPGRYDLDMITLVVAVAPSSGGHHQPELAQLLRASQHPLSVAELAAAVDLPMVVVKVLLSDLIERGEMLFRPPPRNTSPGSDPVILQAVLDSVRKL